MKLRPTILLLSLALGACSASPDGTAAGTAEAERAEAAAAGPPPGEAIERARALTAEAGDLLQSGDTLGFLTAMRDAEALRPGHQTLILQLAWAYAMADSVDRALDTMERYAAFGFVSTTAPGDIPGFGPVMESPRWSVIAARIEGSRAEIGEAAEAFRIPTRDFVPEGVAFDPESGDHYLGSVHRGEIVRVTAAGTVEPFADPSDGLWSAMGMHLDAAHRHLWVATTAAPNFRGYDEADEGRSAILRFDLGRPDDPPTRFEPGSEGPHWFGDLVVAPDGTVYVSDSMGSAVYVIRPGASAMTMLVQSTDFPSPQGIDLAVDGTLYLADYAAGIYAIDTNTGEYVPVAGPPTVSLLGIDGMYWHAGSIIAIQNGVLPHRVTRLDLSADGSRIVDAEILEMNRPWFAEPTLGTIVGDDLLFVANSQWFLFDAEGALPPATEMEPPLVVRRSLAR